MSAMLHADRYLSSETSTRAIARELYQTVAALPIVSPHGHVDSRLFANPNATFGTPADLFIIPDHYVARMLYSQGIEMQRLGLRERESSGVTNDLVTSHSSTSYFRYQIGHNYAYPSLPHPFLRLR